MKPNSTKSKGFEVITCVFLLLMMTVFVLGFDHTGFAGISGIKRTLFYILCGGYVGLILLWIPGSMAAGAVKIGKLWSMFCPSTLPQWLALAYLLLTVVSALRSPHGSVVWLGGSRSEGVLTIAIYCLTFYFVSKFAVVKPWMVYTLGASVTVFSLICILQLRGLNPFAMYPGEYTYFDAFAAYSGAYLGTIGNVDFVAAFLCIVIPILWISVIRMREKYRFVLLLPLSLSLWVLLEMSVLAGLVGVLCGGLLSLPMVAPFSKTVRKWIWILLASGTMIGVAMVYFVDFGSGFLQEMHLLMHGQAEDTFGSGRLYIWKNVLKQLGDGFWLGHGPDTLSLTGIKPFERYDETLGMTIVATIDAAHNEYLNILYHQGVFALASYVGLLGSSLWHFARHAAQKSGVAIAGGAVLCYGIQAFFGISQFITAPFFWIVLGVLEKERDKPEKKLV